MHHPDIHDILLTVEDFLLLSDSQSTWDISPLKYMSEVNHDSTFNHVKVKGIRLRRKLKNGWLDINIVGEEEDCDNVAFEYLTKLKPRKRNETIKIENNDFSVDNVRSVIRRILVLDKESTKSLAPA
jgi:hypothetical protein